MDLAERCEQEGRQVRTMSDTPTQALQPIQGSVFDIGLRDGGHWASHSRRIGTAYSLSPKLDVIV